MAGIDRSTFDITAFLANPMSKVDTRAPEALAKHKPERKTDQLADDANKPHPTAAGNEPPGGNNMETRVAKLESHLEYIHRDLGVVATDVKEIRKDMREDFRIIFGALVVVALGTAGMIAKGLGWL